MSHTQSEWRILGICNDTPSYVSRLRAGRGGCTLASSARAAAIWAGNGSSVRTASWTRCCVSTSCFPALLLASDQYSNSLAGGRSGAAAEAIMIIYRFTKYTFHCQVTLHSSKRQCKNNHCNIIVINKQEIYILKC